MGKKKVVKKVEASSESKPDENASKTEDSVNNDEVKKIEPSASKTEATELKSLPSSSNEGSSKESQVSTEDKVTTGKPVEKKKRKEKESTKTTRRKRSKLALVPSKY